MTFFKRHTWHLSVYAFFLTPLFSDVYSDPIIISIDPIGNTAYYLEPFLPSFQRDLRVYDIRVNGELRFPLSTFVFDVEESPIMLYDSLRTRSTFQFIKGDYAFRDLSMKTQSLTLNGGTLTGFSHTRSYEGVNVFLGEGSLMQNYLVSYNNSFKNSDFSITTAYHNEDFEVPISSDSSSRKVNESYFTGLTFSANTHFGQFSYHSDLQVSGAEIDEIISDKWISNQSAEFEFKKRVQFTSFLKWSQNGENQQLYRVGVTFGNSKTSANLNLAYINNPQVELRFSMKFRNTNIQIERKILDDYTDISQSYILNSLIFGATKNAYYIQIQPNVVTTIRSSYNSYFGGIGYKGDMVMFNMNGKLYNSNRWSLRKFIRFDLQINFQYFERYTPFLKTEYNYCSQQDIVTEGVTPANEFMIIEYGEIIENIHRLNLEFGFNLETFKISYHIRNMLGQDGKFTNNYEQVPIHKYLKVEWKFRN